MSVVCINPQETVCIFSCPNLARRSHYSLSHTSTVCTDEQLIEQGWTREQIDVHRAEQVITSEVSSPEQ